MVRETPGFLIDKQAQKSYIYLMLFSYKVLGHIFRHCRVSLSDQTLRLCKKPVTFSAFFVTIGYRKRCCTGGHVFFGILRIRLLFQWWCVIALAFTATQANAQRIKNVPWATPTFNYTVRSDIVYGQGEVSGGGVFRDLKLDLYIPDIPPPAFGRNVMPLMLMLHPGGLTFGSKTVVSVVESAEEYAKHGWLVAAINYRLQGDNPIPSSRVQALYNALGGATATLRDRTFVAAIDDTLTALDFLHARNDVHDNWTTIWGSSAGGNIALATSFALDDHGIARPPVAVVIELAGRFDRSSVGNPFDSPTTGDPVLMSVIDPFDFLYTYSLETQAWALAAGLPFDFQEVEGSGHPPDMFNYLASTGVFLFQRSVDLHHETVFDGLDQGPQPPPGC